MYIFSKEENIEKVIIGSSNFTAGGFSLNYETNVSITLDHSKNAKDFQKQVIDYWDTLLKDENTKNCESVLLENLLDKGMILDECKQKPFKEIIEKIFDDLPFNTKTINQNQIIGGIPDVRVPQLKQNFAMTLSGFDVSERSQDPVILIPIAALKSMPFFWDFPKFYTYSDAGYPQLFVNVSVQIDDQLQNEQHIRIYYYDKRSEFRLQCESIKRNGSPGDIMIVKKDFNKPMEFTIELIRQKAKEYSTILRLLTNRVSSQKKFAYYN
jgi:hypothetical protein